MTRTQRPPPSNRSRNPDPRSDETIYNIIPLNNLHPDHPSHRFPEVHAAIAALEAGVDLRRSPSIQLQPNDDLLDWLGILFGFQRHNVLNQREHLVLHLANAQMRLQPPPDNITPSRTTRTGALFLAVNPASGSPHPPAPTETYCMLHSIYSFGASPRIYASCLSVFVIYFIIWLRN